MKRIDIILQKLKQLDSDVGISASDLAQQLGLSRANVCNDLNKLCEAGLAAKQGTKPVYYRACESEPVKNLGILEQFKIDNPSMQICVEQAKAAVLYPPNGMHIFLFGETGVGKSMFAALLYQYAVEKGVLYHEAPFVTFNCADYSNNPQLLMSQLFGAVKGAYTGAASDRTGLLEQADTGVLFLDEVHRLPPEGQEMLFSYIDRGVFRRLGESGKERHAQVRLICATSENPSSTMLKTFLRRIPMAIAIPSLSERSIDERVHLISTFFNDEAARLQRSIRVSVNTIRALTGYKCTGNIGQLKADIRILCARAYSLYLQGQKDDIVISSHDLPVNIKNGLYIETEHRLLWSRLSAVHARFLTFPQTPANPLMDQPVQNGNIYQVLDELSRSMKRMGATSTQIGEGVNQILHEYYNRYREQTSYSDDDIARVAGSEVASTTEAVLSHAQKRLGRFFGKNIYYGVAMHLKAAISRVEGGYTIRNPKLEEIKADKTQLYAVAVECLQIVNDDFQIRMPEDEAGFLALFFDEAEITPQKNRVQVIVAAHGISTASSMVQTANRLLGQQLAVGFDANLDEQPERTYLAIKQYIIANQCQQILLLFDMGSLESFATDLSAELDVTVKCIPLVSTLHVLEATRKASLGYSLDEIYEDALQVASLTSTATSEKLTDQGTATMYIVTLCATGEGCAAMLLDILSSELHYNAEKCKIVALQATNEELLSEKISNLQKDGEIICVVGALRTKLSVPHYSITDVLNHTAIQEIQQRIDFETLLLAASKSLGSMLMHIDFRTAARAIRQMILQTAQRLECSLEDEMFIGIFCHLGCMLDRLKGGGTVDPFPYQSKMLGKYASQVQIVRQECRYLASRYTLSVPEDEIYYITALFMKESLL